MSKAFIWAINQASTFHFFLFVHPSPTNYFSKIAFKTQLQTVGAFANLDGGPWLEKNYTHGNKLGCDVSLFATKKLMVTQSVQTELIGYINHFFWLVKDWILIPWKGYLCRLFFKPQCATTLHTIPSPWEQIESEQKSDLYGWAKLGLCLPLFWCGVFHHLSRELRNDLSTNVYPLQPISKCILWALHIHNI